MIVDPTAYIELPPGFWEALVFCLAERLAVEYQFTMRDDTQEIARMSLKRLKRINQRTPSLSTDVGLRSSKNLRYNIFVDGYGPGMR